MPNRALSVCCQPGCNELTAQRLCEIHEKQRISGGYNNRKGTRQQQGYGRAWQRLRKIVLAHDNHLCRICRHKGILTPATEVDHIVPKARGGTDELTNLQSICAPCHREKTLSERAR